MNTGYMQMLSKGFKPVFLNFGEGRNTGFFMSAIFVTQINLISQINDLISLSFHGFYVQLTSDLIAV